MKTKKITVMFYMYDCWVATRRFPDMAAAKAYIAENPENLSFDEWRTL